METQHLATNVALIQQDIGYIKESIEKLEHTINGNGKKGILDRLASLERRVWVLWGVGALMLSAGGFCIAQGVDYWREKHTRETVVVQAPVVAHK